MWVSCCVVPRCGVRCWDNKKGAGAAQRKKGSAISADCCLLVIDTMAGPSRRVFKAQARYIYVTAFYLASLGDFGVSVSGVVKKWLIEFDAQFTFCQ